MLTGPQRAFLRHFADDACSSVQRALAGAGLSSADFRDACQSPEFLRATHEMLASLEMAHGHGPDPFDFAPEPFVSCSLPGASASVDPFGPTHGGWAYNHSARSFADGTPASALSPSDVVWFNTAADWKGLDKAVSEAREP